MKDELHHLKHLPNGIFICEDGVFKVEDGEVTRLSSDPGPVSRIGTIDDDPKNSGG